jgi:hypothetical protein
MTRSPVDLRRVNEARTLLAPRGRIDSLSEVTLAAAFFALTALALALTVLLLPTPWPM